MSDPFELQVFHPTSDLSSEIMKFVGIDGPTGWKRFQKSSVVIRNDVRRGGVR